MLCDAVQGLGPGGDPRGPRPGRRLGAQDPRPQGRSARLWMRKGAEPAPLIHGGGQEQGLRSGTLSPALCVGFGAAAKLAVERRDARPRRMSSGCGASRSTALGPELDDQRQRRRSAITAISTSAATGSTAARLIADLRDIAFSLGSACASGSGRPSHVLRALGPRPTARRARRSASASAATPSEASWSTPCGRIDEAARRAGGAGRVTLVRFSQAPTGRSTREVEAAAGRAPARRRLGGRPAARGRVRGGDGLLDLPRDRRRRRISRDCRRPARRKRICSTSPRMSRRTSRLACQIA